jgi:hypothetical protein
MSSRSVCRPRISGTVSTITTPPHTSARKKWAIAVPIITALAVPVEQWCLGEPSKCKDPMFLQQLVDCNPQRRATARAVLLTCRLPKEYVDPILRQTSDIDKVCAAPTPAPPSGSVPHPAPPNDPLPSELRAKNLLRVLIDASDYATANSPEESERALKLYLAVLPQLSRQATSALDPQLMREYDAAMNSHDTGRAVNLLSSAFRPYVTKQ